MTAKGWRDGLQAAAALGYGYRYRRWVRDSLTYIDVQDLAAGGDHIPELADVYVDVALASPVPGTAAEDGAARQSLGELLSGRDRMVLALVGQPGSGKSTLLAHAARGSAQRLVPGRGHIPVLLPLRRHAETIIADPVVPLPTVARLAAGARAGREPGGWWERQLHRGRCLVLLDGLDEVAHTGDRQLVADWVERQVAAYPRTSFVVTARPYGLPASLAAQADVRVLRPLTSDQLRLFLDRWYLAAERHATGASSRNAGRAVQARAQDSAAQLNALLRDHPALSELAVNPLLLTMIAAAHRYRGALPGSRGDLYGEICRVLLSRRVQAGQQPELLPWSARQSLLAMLAYQMMRDHVSQLPADRITRLLHPQLERFGPPVTGKAFLDDVARSGLLVEASAGRYAFAHLTFQEYLAARHVSAAPDQVKVLADNVDDRWWHETILLYVAAADASSIVRACLDSGTITALTLAFDCTEASTEVDPELRRQLDRERTRAYQPGCTPEHRRLIAGVQAARLVRRTRATAAGTRVCTDPVPADLYWLFLADTGAPRPDRQCTPDTGETAVGIWGTEAQAFASWLNSITATATGIEVRLPRPEELADDAIAGSLGGQLPALATGAWTQPHLRLWLRPGLAHPHELPGSALRQAVTADAGNTPLLPQVLTAAVLDVSLRIVRDLDDIRALAIALADDLTARARSEGRLVDLMHAHARAIVHSYAHALALTRSDVVTLTRGADPELIASLNGGTARVVADAVGGDLAEALDCAQQSATALADAIELDFSVLSAFDFDVTQVMELARVHVLDLDRAHVLARGLLYNPELGIASVLGLPSVGGLEPAIALPAILGLPLRWVGDGPLAAALLQVLAAHPAAGPGGARPQPGSAQRSFAAALVARAGIDEVTPLRAALGSPLTTQLADLAEVAGRGRDRAPSWSQAAVLRRLTDALTPLCLAHQVPDTADAAALRAVALGLAGGGLGGEAPGLLRSAAATVTVAANRAAGGSPAGEIIVLALV